jgi:predicted dehydrogenase
MPRQPRVLNVAVIGLGMGRHHLRSYHEHARSRASAVCDTDEGRLREFAAQYALPPERCFSDYRKLLAARDTLGLDAVSVALPNVLHAPVSIAALKAGLHVLCEKPMAMNAREARAMLAAAEKAGRKLMINLSYRFTPHSQALKRVVDSGALGDVYYGRTVWHRRRGLPKFGGWFGQKKLSGGGPIIDLGVHRLDLAMWLMGNPRPATVSASTYNVIGKRLAKEQKKTFDVEDLGCALIRFDNGATLILEASWAGHSEKREDMVTQLWGTRGGLVQRNVGEGYELEARLFTEHGDTLWNSQLQQTALPCPTPYQEFVDAVLDDRDPLATARHGLDVQLILDAIYRSAATGREVRIKPLSIRA